MPHVNAALRVSVFYILITLRFPDFSAYLINVLIFHPLDHSVLEPESPPSSRHCQAFHGVVYR